MSEVDFSVVIPTWNRVELTVRLLESLERECARYTGGRTEVIVVDSSEGANATAISSACERLGARYLRGSDSVRVKRNTGIRESSFEVVCFLDSDVVVLPGLLDAHAEPYRSDESLASPLGGTFGLTRFVGPDTFFWRVIEATSMVDAFSFALRQPYVTWCLGNNVTFRREALLDVGLFEEDFPFKLGGDDLDLSYRMTKAGYVIRTCPDAVTEHAKETWVSIAALWDRARRWGTMEYLISKRHPEVVHPALPRTGDVATGLVLVAAAMGLALSSWSPVALALSWCIVAMALDFARRPGPEPRSGLVAWLCAQAIGTAYRWHQMLAALRARDPRMVFAGQYFDRHHMGAAYEAGARRVRDHVLAFVVCMIGVVAWSLVT